MYKKDLWSKINVIFHLNSLIYQALKRYITVAPCIINRASQALPFLTQRPFKPITLEAKQVCYTIL